MLNIASHKLPVALTDKVIACELENARQHKEREPEIANYFYKRVEVALHKLAEHEGIREPSFYDRKHYFREARFPETAGQKALQQNIAEVHFARGEVFSRLNQVGKAEAQYQKADEWGHPMAREALVQLSSYLNRPSGSLSGFHKPPPSSSAFSTFSAGRLSTSTSSLVEAPAFKFFLKNMPLIPPALPQAGQLLRNAEQLAYCLLLLYLDQQEPTSTIKLREEESVWLERVKQNQDDQGFRLLAEDVIRAYEKDELKDASAVAEVVALAPVYTCDDFQKLLNKFITKLCELELLDLDVLRGLAGMIRHAPPASLRTDDLVQILENLADRLENNHAQSGENQYRLAMAICQVLDAMADNHVTDLDREKLHEPLKNFFNGLKHSKDPYLVYQAEYACQALARVPDDETPWRGAWRRASGIFRGVMKFAKAAKAFDVEGFIDGLKDLQEPLSELAQFVSDTYKQMRELKESGQELIESLKDGFSFERKHVWYPMLRGMDEVPSDQLDTFKQNLMREGLQACRWHKIFLWGLSERLARIAAHPEQASDIRKQALQWLGELYENEQMWSKHPIIKKRVVQLIQMLADNSPVKEDADALLTRLKTVGDIAQQALYQGYLTSPPAPYLLYEDRPQPLGLSLLDKVQQKQWVETDVRRLKAERLAHWGDPLYVPLRGKASLFGSYTDTFDLAEQAKAFFKNHQNKKMALVLGDSGAGKSTFLRFLEATCWKGYQNGGIIPLFIALPTIDNPEQDFIAKHLCRLGLSQAQIKTLKEREFVVIADGYDESRANANLYRSNGFNQPGGWRGQLIVGCRSQHLGDNYRQRFQPDDPDLFQELVVTPIGQPQIDQYVQAYVDFKHQHRTVDDDRFDLQHWQVQDYQRGLTQIDENFNTPLLLKTVLEVLPRLLSLEEQSPISSLTRTAIYDEAMKAQFEREKQRLQEAGLTGALEDAFNALDEHIFIKHCFQFVTKLAVAIYEKNQGNPVVEYDPVKDEGTWKDTFFARQPEQRILRKAWPLTRNGNQYRFEHKSFLEYFVARAVFEPESTIGSVEKKVELTPTLFRRNSVSSILSVDTEIDENEASTLTMPLSDSLLARRNLVEEPEILRFLVERAQAEPVFQKQLNILVEQSKIESSFWQKACASVNHEKDTRAIKKAAANAITILVKAGVQFNGADLKGIQVPRADLSFGVFDSAQLQGADLRGVKLRGTWLRQVNLSDARMGRQKLGEWPYLEEGLGKWPYLEEGLETFRIYIAPVGKLKVNSRDHFDLESLVKEFLVSEKKVLLLLGEAGSGKSTFIHHFTRHLWVNYTSSGRQAECPIPLFVPLGRLDNPGKNLIEQYLEEKGLSRAQIEALRAERCFIFMLDGYDEIVHRSQMSYVGSGLDRWQAKIVVSSRPQSLENHYRYKFCPPNGLDLLEECWLMEFSDKQIDAYIDKYAGDVSDWPAQMYKKAFQANPQLKELARTPLMLKMVLAVLPELKIEALGDQLKFMLIDLYEQFVASWLHRSQKRLMEVALTPTEQEVFESLLKEGFAEQGLAFNQNLAVAMYEKQLMVVKYSEAKDAKNEDWLSQYLSNTEEKTRMLRFISLLSREGDYYRFIDKSILDYFVARAVREELGHSAQVDHKLLLNRLNLVEDAAIQRFLVEYVEQDRELVEQLLIWIKASETEENVRQGAENARAILVGAGVEV